MSSGSGMGMSSGMQPSGMQPSMGMQPGMGTQSGGMSGHDQGKHQSGGGVLGKLQDLVGLGGKHTHDSQQQQQQQHQQQQYSQQQNYGMQGGGMQSGMGIPGMSSMQPGMGMSSGYDTSGMQQPITLLSSPSTQMMGGGQDLSSFGSSSLMGAIPGSTCFYSTPFSMFQLCRLKSYV